MVQVKASAQWLATAMLGVGVIGENCTGKKVLGTFCVLDVGVNAILRLHQLHLCFLVQENVPQTA